MSFWGTEAQGAPLAQWSGETLTCPDARHAAERGCSPLDTPSPALLAPAHLQQDCVRGRGHPRHARNSRAGRRAVTGVLQGAPNRGEVRAMEGLVCFERTVVSGLERFIDMLHIMYQENSLKLHYMYVNF